MARRAAKLDDFERGLRDGGYSVALTELAGYQALLGETPYALVGCVSFSDWRDLEERVFDLQAALTRVAAEAPQPVRGTSTS